MIIHVVEQGDTVQSIADSYGVPIDLIISDNGVVVTRGDLIPGQTIVITFPEQIHVVKSGETLQDIAINNNISLLDLLKNNPYLSDRQYIYPGDTLIISYGDKIRSVTTNGYTSGFIDIPTLKKTLPYLTYLSIFGYRVVGDGQVIGIDDTEILQLANLYQVAPIMIITTLSTLGQENVENAYTILNSEANMDRLIDNLIVELKAKGYYGINITYELLSNLTLSAYEVFNEKAYTRFKKEGLAYIITIAPNIVFTATEITFEKVDYSKIVNQADQIVILNYLWGTYLGPPAPVASISKINEFLDYMLTMVLPEKITLGLPLFGYDWELPYIIGLTKANLISLTSALLLAKQYSDEILFDPASQTPYYTYNTSTEGIPFEQIVWFIDARIIDEALKIITERGLKGIGLWNIAGFIPQLWTVINTQYDIERIT